MQPMYDDETGNTVACEVLTVGPFPCGRVAERVLYPIGRTDRQALWGVACCADCDDALMQSGLFTDQAPSGAERF